MFKKRKDKEMDLTSLNHILKTGKKLINITYLIAIVCFILLITYLLKEWHLLKYIGEFFVTISPIFIGLLIAWFFDPFASYLEEKRIPRVVACIFIYILFIGFLFLISYLFIPSLMEQVKDFLKAAPEIFESVTDFTIQFIKRFDSGNYINIKQIKREVTNLVAEYGISFTADLPKYLFNFTKSVISGGLNFILGLMIGFYLLFDFSKVTKAVYRIIPNDYKDDYSELTHRINTSLRSYVQGLLIVMSLVFITQSIGLSIAGLTSPILFALFCALTDIIPYFGPYIGAAPAVVVGFTISPIIGICVIVSILIVQLLENNFYQPLIMGHTMKLHPVTIMIGLVIFGHFFGIIGMIIATPCIACFKVIVTFIIERTELLKKVEAEKE